MSRKNRRQEQDPGATTQAEIAEDAGAGRALRESEERLEFLYSKIPAMLHSIDMDGRIVEVSDRWLETLRYPREEIIGRKCVEFLTEESRRYAETVALPEFWSTGEARNVAFQFVRKDGEIADVLLSAVAEPDREGRPARRLAVLTEVIDKRIAEALQRSMEETEARTAGSILWRNPYGLTVRELTVLRLVAAGKANKEIASELSISLLTVHKHVSNILGKMNATSRTEAGVRAVREGLLP